MSADTLHIVSLKDILTDGVKAIHAIAPVAPPTQFPQVSKNAVPLMVLLQSAGSFVVTKVSVVDHAENTELSVEQ